jgi:glycogen(starch) synthase
VKILIYSPKFYPSVGGLENLTLMLSREFIKKGHSVKVICFEQDNGTPCGVETYYSPSAMKQVQLFIWSSVFYMPNISLKGIWLLLFNPFKKWVVSHNAWYGPNNANNNKSLNERFKLFLLKFAGNISVSKAIANYIPVPSIVIPNCYDADIFNQQYEQPRANDLLFVGRLVSDKGIDVLINACLLLWEKGADFKLYIVGKGEMGNWIIDTINKYGLENKVLLKGKMIGTALAAEMNAHAIMIVPSTWQEPFGIVALEGLACGCKVICSSGGGLPEAVGEFGDLFPNGNAAELAALIENNLGKPYSPNKGQLDGFLNMHSPSSVADKYINVFNS